MGKKRLALFADVVLAIIIGLLGLVLAATVYPPVMLYSVLITLLVLRGCKRRNNHVPTDEILYCSGGRA